jgi:hypothetical protein
MQTGREQTGRQAERAGSQIEEMVTRRGHLAFLYPKYHCELNHIKNYSGWSKR